MSKAWGYTTFGLGVWHLYLAWYSDIPGFIVVHLLLSYVLLGQGICTNLPKANSEIVSEMLWSKYERGDLCAIQLVLQWPYLIYKSMAVVKARGRKC